VVFGVPEDLAEIRCRGVEPLVVQHLGERHLDVEIIFVDRPADVLGAPRGQLVLRDDLFHVDELRRATEAHPDHLARPAAPDLVAQIVDRYLSKLRGSGAARED
jgi:hypothetical protein